jgi:hypothetical protein
MKPQNVPAITDLTHYQLHADELRKARKIELVTNATEEANTDHYIAMLNPANGITPCPYHYEMDDYKHDEIYELKTVWFSRMRELCQLPDSANWSDIQNHFKQMETKNMNSHTPFDQLPTAEQAWQLGYQEAASHKADIKANPYTDNSEESYQWLKGFDNCMNLLYGDKEEV